MDFSFVSELPSAFIFQMFMIQCLSDVIGDTYCIFSVQSDNENNFSLLCELLKALSMGYVMAFLF